MKLTERNIFEEIEYAFFTVHQMNDIDRQKWLRDRYGIYNATKMHLLVWYIGSTTKDKSDTD